MALTTVEYTYSGQASFAIPFSLGILNRAYVTIQINNQVDGSGDPLYYTNFTWTSDSEVVISGLTNGDIIKIARTIPSNLLLSDYTAGSNITRDNLNIANKQLIMLIHEVLDKNGTQQTKLDTIEPNAKDDQTPAQIKTAYESIANTNAFTDADESKLDGIEAGADITDTANVTAAGAVMDSEVTDLAGIKAVTVSTLQVKPSEGAFVDGDKTKLNTIETNADVTDTANVVAALTAGTNITIASDGTIASTAEGGGGGVSDIVEDLTPQLGGDLDLNNQDITGTGNISITGTVNGRTLGTDGTKLDAIEALADVTDTDNVVAALTAGTNVTIAADGTISSTDTNTNTTYTIGDGGLTTNDFTDADHTKLDGIEAGATADQTKADIDALNIDADTLDGQHGSYYTSYADTAVANIVDSAPGTLDTLNELAQALGDDPNFATTTATNLSQKLPKSGGTMTGAILFNDGVKAKFGDSSDLQIWHNGTDSYVYDTGEGDLILRGSSNIKLQSAGGTALSTFTAAGASTLYYSAAEKLATTSSGIDVTGAIDVATSGASNSSNAIAIATSGTNFESDGGIISIDHAASGAVTGGYFSKYSAGGTLRHSIKGDGTGYFAGRLGIGHTSPVAKMAILGSSNTTVTEANSNLCVEGSGGNGMLFGTLSTSGFKSYIQSGFVSNLGLATYDLLLNPEGGNVGIGTTSPAHELHIESTSPTIRLVDTDGSNTLDITQSGSASYLTFDNNMRFRNASNVEKLRIDSDGIDVTGVTKTSGSGYNPSNTGWATNASLITSGSYGGGLTMLDGSAGYSIRVENSGADLVIGQGATSGGLAQKVKITSTGIDVTGKITVASTDPEIFLTDTSTSVTHSIDANSGVGNLFMQVDKNETGSDPKLVVNVGSQDNVLVAKSTGVDVTGATSTTGTQGTRQWSAGSAGQKLGIYAYDNSTFYHRLETGNATNYQWGAYDNIPIYTITNNSIKTTLTADGNFGIGSTAPTAKLDVRGDVRIEATSGFAFMEMGGPSGAFIDLKAPFSDDYDLRVQQDGGQSKIRTTGTSVQVDTSSGYLHLGPQNTSYCHFTTDRTRYYFNQNLVVAGNRVVSSYGGDLLLQRSQASSQQISIGLSQVVMTGQLNIAGANPSSNNGAFEVPVINSSTPAIVSVSAGTTSLRTHHSFENSNGQVGKINTAGTGTYYITSSDYRLKTDVQPMQGSIDRVKALKPCNFEWISDGTRIDGFLAHEAQEVVPEAVDGEKDAMRDKVNIITPLIEATYDEEGNELTPEIPAVTETEQVPDYQGIDQSKLVPLLTSALQEALAKIDDLELRMANLEN